MTDTTFAGGTGIRARMRSATAAREEPFRFTGDAREWFGIWIVNILLTILTVGIYSAWAKVRTKRYFLGHTSLDGHTFDYHAQPKQILIGRIIAIVVLAGLNLVSQVSPFAAIGVLVAYGFLLPWAIVRGLSFNANMTSYRNVRFGFEGTKRQAFMATFGWPALGILAASLIFGLVIGAAGGFDGSQAGPDDPILLVLGGILAFMVLLSVVPLTSRAYAKLLGMHRYGTSRFACSPPLSRYWKALGLAVLIGFGGLVVLGAASLGLLWAGGAMNGETSGISALAIVPAFLIYVFVFVGPVVYAALSRNAFFDSLELENGHRFVSDLPPLGYAWVVVSNIVVSVLTLGLMVPWAQIRLARYKAKHTRMLPAGPLDNVVAGEKDRTGVAQGEFLDLDGGFDFGF